MPDKRAIHLAPGAGATVTRGVRVGERLTRWPSPGAAILSNAASVSLVFRLALLNVSGRPTGFLGTVRAYTSARAGTTSAANNAS
jgi:hypothetical protein